MTSELKAGYARRIISPPKGIYLIGYGDRIWGNRGVHDNLTASAIALDDGNDQVVIVACDLLAINEITLSEVEEAVDTNLIICCSHTHSGPIVYADRRSPQKNKKYVDFLVNQLIAVTTESISNLKPASLYWGESKAEISVNRRERISDGRIVIGFYPEGVIDKKIGIIQVRNEYDDPMANLVNFSCHNVVLGPKNLLVSADWAGAMRRNVESATGVPCLFFQGATGDLNPNHDWGENDFLAVERLGNQAAEGVLSGLCQLVQFESTPLKFRKSVVWLPLETEVRSQQPPVTYKDKLSAMVGVPKFLVNRILNHRYPWVTRLEPREGFWSIPMSMIAVRMGCLTWVGMGAEVFTGIGLRVKNMVSSKQIFFSSLTNGCVGYIPTEGEYLLGGYEIDIAPYAYRLPGRFQKNIEKIVIDHAQKILSKQ
jgi:hypothetical protein